MCDANFQTIYYKTVGAPLQVKLRTKAAIISILLPILSTASVMITHYVIRTEEMKINRSFILQGRSFILFCPFADWNI